MEKQNVQAKEVHYRVLVRFKVYLSSERSAANRETVVYVYVSPNYTIA